MTHIPEALRREVAARGESRCEYCRLHEDDAYFSHEIDHIYAEKHGGPISSPTAPGCWLWEDTDNRHNKGVFR